MGLSNHIAWLVAQTAQQFATMQATIFALVVSRCVILFDLTEFSAMVHVQHASSLLT